MYKEAELMFLYCETALHAGAGSGVGRIDLPIQRESHTGFPKIESSGLKGSIREVFEGTLNPADDTVNILFGHEQSESSGALGFTDARLLLFPVRSAKGIFAWITCPRVLWQLKKDYALLRKGEMQIGGIAINKNEIMVPGGSQIISGNSAMLEEFVFKAIDLDVKINTGTENAIGDWLASELFNADEPFQKLLKTHFAIVDDEIFSHYVNLYTEVVTRNRIDNETGVVQNGALFTEEYLPPHSVLYSLVLASPQFSKPQAGKSRLDAAQVIETFLKTFPEDTYFQAGGNASIGKGILKARFYSMDKERNNGKS